MLCMGQRKGRRKALRRTSGKKKAGHNVVAVCMKGLHQKMAMANLVVCPVSLGKSEKILFDWAADMQSWLEPPLPYTVRARTRQHRSAPRPYTWDHFVKVALLY